MARVPISRFGPARLCVLDPVLVPEVADCILDCDDLLGMLIRNFDILLVLAEFFFKRHDEFDHVQRICIEVIDEGGFGCNPLCLHAELIDNNLRDPF